MPEITVAAVVFALIGWLGHTAIAVAVKNRIDARAFPPWILHTHSIIHALIVVAGFPLCLFAVQGVLQSGFAATVSTGIVGETAASSAIANPVHTGSLFHAGEFQRAAQCAYLVVCVLAVFGTLVIRVLRRLRAPSRDFRTTRSQLRRFTAESSERGVRGFAASIAAGLPGNQSLDVEINDKTVSTPTTAAGLNGLTILHFSDTHFAGNLQPAYFRWALAAAMQAPVDLVVFTGDLLDEPGCIEWLPETFGTLQARLGCHFVLGNHDDHAGCVPQIRAALQDLGWNDATLQQPLIASNGSSIELYGTEFPWIGQLPEVAAIKPLNAMRILISHSPDTICWAAARGFDLVLAGHNHGGQIQLPWFGPVYSPSQFGSTFASGCFTVNGTRLHVSRGLGSRFPLRWNCPPEITRLVFRLPDLNST